MNGKIALFYLKFMKVDMVREKKFFKIIVNIFRFNKIWVCILMLNNENIFSHIDQFGHAKTDPSPFSPFFFEMRKKCKNESCRNSLSIFLSICHKKQLVLHFRDVDFSFFLNETFCICKCFF